MSRKRGIQDGDEVILQNALKRRIINSKQLSQFQFLKNTWQLRFVFSFLWQFRGDSKARQQNDEQYVVRRKTDSFLFWKRSNGIQDLKHGRQPQSWRNLSIS